MRCESVAIKRIPNNKHKYQAQPSSNILEVHLPNHSIATDIGKLLPSIPHTLLTVRLHGMRQQKLRLEYNAALHIAYFRPVVVLHGLFGAIDHSSVA